MEVRLSKPRRGLFLSASAAAALIIGLAGNGSARAQAAPPDVVKLPSGLNLGGSSFYDGFGRTTPGWLYLNFARWNHYTSIKDDHGHSSPAFQDPRIDTFSNLFHVVYFTPYGGSKGLVTFEALMPIVGFDTRFNPSGAVLKDNGLGVGDLTFGVDYQARPVHSHSGSVFTWRAGLDFVAPTGSFDARRDLNQGSGFWSITPYLAMTLLPAPKWEVSTRLNYDYNFKTSLGGDPPPIPGFTFRNGQAGQAAWIIFASSYEVAEGIRPGINGYYLRQVNDDRANGASVPHSRAEEFFLGPGLSWQRSRKSVMNLQPLPADYREERRLWTRLQHPEHRSVLRRLLASSDAGIVVDAISLACARGGRMPRPFGRLGAIVRRRG